MVSSTQNYVLRRSAHDPNEVLHGLCHQLKVSRNCPSRQPFKFYMAKDLLDNPDIRQAERGLQQKTKTLISRWAYSNPYYH